MQPRNQGGPRGLRWSPSPGDGATPGSVRAGGFEDPQPEQSQHHHQGEVVVVAGLASRRKARLELQVGQPESRRFGGHGRAAHVLGRRPRQQTVDDAGAVEPGQHRDPPPHGGRFEPAGLLHPADVPLQVDAGGTVSAGWCAVTVIVRAPIAVSEPAPAASRSECCYRNRCTATRIGSAAVPLT